jgi:hypothetical protein
MIADVLEDHIVSIFTTARRHFYSQENLRSQYSIKLSPFSLLPDVKYSYVVDQQPIGRLLFRQFCEDAKPEYHRYNIFLDYIVSF